MNRSIGANGGRWPKNWMSCAGAVFLALQSVSSGYGQAPEKPITEPAPPAPGQTENEAPKTEGTTEVIPEKKDPLQKLWEIPVPPPVDVQVPESGTTTPAAPLAEPTSSGDGVRKAPPTTAMPGRKDPVFRTGLSNAQNNAEMVSEGIDGTSLADSVFLPAKVVKPGSGVILGPAILYPAFRVGMTYRNTTGSGGGSDQNGFHPTVGASFDLSLGEPELRRTLRLTYSGQYEFLTSNTGSSDRRPFTQQLALRGDFSFAKLDLGLGITYSGLSGASRDFGGNVERDFLTVALTATMALTPKTTIDWDLSVPIRRYAGGVNSSGFTSTTFVNYIYSPKTQVGLGISAGTLESQGSDTQQFVQFLGRANLASSEIYNFFGTFGVEFRSTGAEDKINPVFGLGASWNPRLGTSFSLTAENRVQSSGAQAESDYMTTSIAAAVSQRLGDRMNLSLTLGYENAQYFSTVGSTGPERHDQSVFGGIALSAQLSPRLQGAITYSYRNTRSNESPFTDSVAQAQLSFVY